MKNLFATNHIVFGISRNQFPSPIADKGIILIRHSLTPFRIFKWLRYRYKFKDIFGVKLGRKVKFLNGFVDIVFGSSDYDSW